MLAKSSQSIGVALKRIAHALHHLGLLLVLMLAAANARAADYTFGGAGVTGCTLSGTVYTCATLPMTGGTDSMTIADGYTVNVTANINLGYNQTLRMSGTARLTSKGSLNVGDVATANLRITGGYLVAAGTVTVGSQQQTITADISGDTINVGNGSRTVINGALNASGTINLGSNSVVNGSVTGRDITTRSPAEINGNVTAGSTFTLASGSSVDGNVVAPVVVMRASSSTINGNVDASTSLTVESGNKIFGNVTAGELEMKASNAIINGTANVIHADLDWAARITGMITCRQGTTPGKCDCVDNNSGWAVNTAMGPNCSAPAAAAPHHLRIFHPAVVPRCAPSGGVQLVACANAACTAPHYSAAYTVTLNPGNTSYTIQGTNSTPLITYAGKPKETLSVSPAGANPTVCKNSETGADTDCGVTFSDSGFAISVPSPHSAETTQTATITALKYSGQAAACLPEFGGTTKTVQLSCAYASPATAKPPVRILGTVPATPLNAAKNLADACDAAGQGIALAFDATGKASTTLRYAEAGAMTLTAKIDALGMTGSATFISTPASLAFNPVETKPTAGSTAKLVAPYRKGIAQLSGLNAAGTTLVNFLPDQSNTNAALRDILVDSKVCAPSTAVAKSDKPTTIAAINDGRIEVGYTWLEAGAVDISASLRSYLGATLASQPKGSTNTSTAVCASSVRFVPAWFDLEQIWQVGQTADRTFFYSGEPIGLKATAKNADGVTTMNYHAAYAPTPTFVVSTTGVPGAIAFTSPSAPFQSGVADNLKPTFTFAAKSLPTPWEAPRQIQLVIKNDDAESKPDDPQAKFWIRQGRLRLSNRFGPTRLGLKMPVAAEYWSGNSWLHNAEDDYTSIPAASVSAYNSKVTVGAGAIKLLKGRGNIALSAGERATSTVALNLGTATLHTACLADKRTSTGANLAYLRSVFGSCAGAPAHDPWARASFGVFSPETRRIIYVRESFN